MKIGARTDDWHSGNPNVRVGAWLGMVAGAVIAVVLLLGLVGTLLNSGSGATLH